MIQVTLVVIRVSLCTRNLNDAINVHLYWWEREEIVLGIKQPTNINDISMKVRAMQL